MKQDVITFYQLLNKHVETVRILTLRKKGMTLSQFKVLLEICHHNHINLQDLTNELNHEKSTVSRIVETLHQRGYVNAEKTKTDRRTLDLSLTDEGNAFIRSFLKESLVYYQKIMDNLSVRERDALLSAIPSLSESIAKNLEELKRQQENGNQSD